jgi:drug/metabolite transporter (DMT)-like permease
VYAKAAPAGRRISPGVSWFSLAVLTAVFTSTVSIVDKIVVERFLRDRWSFPFFIAAFLGAYAVGLLAIRGALGLFRLPPVPVLAVALLPGVVHYVSSVLYTRTLLLTDAATVAAITQTAPLFAVILGWWVFGELFGPLNYAGIVLSVVCSALLSAEQTPAARRVLNPVLLMTLASAGLRSVGDLFVKVTLQGQDYWNTFALSRAALLPITLLLLFNREHRRLLAGALRANGLVLLPGMALLELLAIVPLVLSTVAYARGPLGPVSAVRYTTPLFVLGLTVILNRIHRNLVPEGARSGSLLRRVMLTVGILTGVILIRA